MPHPQRYARAQLAVPLTDAETPLREQVARVQAAGAELVELRVDLINEPAAVAELLAEPHGVQFILTVRSPDEGGHWDGTEAERIALIERLGLLNPGLVDVELATWQRSANLRQKIGLVCETNTDSTRPRNLLILSHHDFQNTPADLAPIFEALLATPAHVIKAVFTPQDTYDACRVLAALRDYRTQRPTIALAMGEAGLVTRVLARKFDAYLSFAAQSAAQASAPGQVDAPTMRSLYRWGDISGSTCVFGVIGWPVTHSLSPQLHNAAMRADGIDGVYLPLPVAPGYDAFARFMDYVAANAWLDFRGFSVTLPHKEHAYRWLVDHGGEIDALAERCQAVNTIYQTRDGKWRGKNTDAEGVLAALDEANTDSAGFELKSAAILGAGGAARAAVAALQSRGVAITLYNRTTDKAVALASQMQCQSAAWEDRRKLDAQLVVNCTSVGLWPDVDVSPLPAEAWREGMVAFDTIYNPLQTRFLREAQQAGAAIVTGDRMFTAQAEAQYRTWHGKTPENVMKAVFAQVIAATKG